MNLAPVFRHVFFMVAVGLFAAPPAVFAQDAPVKALRVVVPFPPGGAVDTLARALSAPLTRGLGQSLVIDNRPGANTVIATEAVARAAADGNTLLLMATSFSVNPSAHSKLPYDSLSDFAGVSRLAYNPLIICAHPSLPVRTVKELVALARARPRELTWGVASILGGGRIAGELFREAASIELTNVPYGGGGPATVALLGGHTSLLVGNVLECSPYLPSGRVRAIAVTSLARSNAVPQVPTVAESGYPGFDATNWFGAMVRAGTTKATVDRLSAEIGRALQLPEVNDALSRVGLTAGAMTPGEFDTFIRNEMQKNGRIVRSLKLKVE
jgi:tripartite-type tricarboxylate transporter receptor subunit TctC